MQDHNSDEEKEDIKSVQARCVYAITSDACVVLLTLPMCRDGICRPLEGDYGEDHDNEEQMET